MMEKNESTMMKNDRVTLEREFRKSIYKGVTFELKHPKDRQASFIIFSTSSFSLLLLFIFLVPAEGH